MFLIVPHARQYRRTRPAVRNALIPPLLLALAPLTACQAFRDAPAGATSVLQLFFQPTSTADIAKQALDPRSADNRYRGTLALARAPFGGDDPYLAHYLDCLADADAGVRSAGLLGLALHGSPRQAPEVAVLLDDPDPRVRADAARTLQRLHNPLAVEPLIAAATSTSPDDIALRSEAAHALGQYPQPRVLDALIASLDSPDLAVNHAALSSLTILTGQDFGYDTQAWFTWTRSTPAPFASGRVYTYPVFDRRLSLLARYVPFIPRPPSEVPTAPAGLARP